MNAFILGLATSAVGLLFARLILNHHARLLRANEQAYRFHAIRDQLQLLAVDGEVDQQSEIYQFLIWVTNLAIRNAGTMKLRDVLQIARNVEQRLQGAPPRLFEEALRKESRPLQEVASATFDALAQMLLANDWLVRSWMRCTFVLRGARERFLHPLLMAVRAFADRFLPDRASAVDYAREYTDFADRLVA